MPSSTGTQRPSLRLAILNRHFWPISNSAEMEVAWLATALSGEGCAVDVLTVRWQKFWPERPVYRDVNVIRLPKPQSGPFGRHRFSRAIVAHLDQQNYDAVLAFGLEDEALAVAGVAQTTPVVLRVNAEHVNATKVFGKRLLESLKRVKAILVDHVQTARTLASQFDDRESIAQKIQVVDSCIEMDTGFIEDLLAGDDVAPFRSLGRQSAARAALSDAHPILQLQTHQSLVVTCTSMVSPHGVCDLVKAWKAVQENHPMARLWIIGDDPNSRDVWNEILEQDLVYSVMMPGFFDCLGEIFQAADLYIHPTRSELPCCVLAAARAHGLCTVATQTDDGLRQLAADRAVDLSEGHFWEQPGQGLFVPRQSPLSLANTINEVLRDVDFCSRVGNQSRKAFAKQVSCRPQVKPWLAPFLNDGGPAKAPLQESAPSDVIDLPSIENTH